MSHPEIGFVGGNQIPELGVLEILSMLAWITLKIW